MARLRYRKSFLALVLAAMAVLGMIRYTAGERSDISVPEKAALDLVAPLQMTFSFITGYSNHMFQAVFNYEQVKNENADLRRGNEEMNRQNQLLKGYQLENIRLRELLRLKQQKEENYELMAATVIARDPSDWFQSLTLNRGSADGIQKDMVVINHDGLVGRILSVSQQTSQVLLLTDREGPVPGMIQITREPGIVEAKGDSTGVLQMINLRRDAVIRENQLVVTSGLGKIYPKNLRVGYVVEVRSDPSGLTKEAVIKPTVDFYRLEEVFIIMHVKKPEEG